MNPRARDSKKLDRESSTGMMKHNYRVARDPGATRNNSPESVPLATSHVGVTRYSSVRILTLHPKLEFAVTSVVRFRFAAAPVH